MKQNQRCTWPKNPLAIAYHDEEWGVPVHEDRKLFEGLTLEGAQAGLSWDTILAKRENYRRAFERFDVKKVAAYGARDRRRLLADAGIVRHSGKIDAAIEPRRSPRTSGSGVSASWGRPRCTRSCRRSAW